MNKLLFLVLSVLSLSCVSCGDGTITDLDKEPNKAQKIIKKEENGENEDVKTKKIIGGREFYMEKYTTEDCKEKLNNVNLYQLIVDTLNQRLCFNNTNNIFEKERIFPINYDDFLIKEKENGVTSMYIYNGLVERSIYVINDNMVLLSNKKGTNSDGVSTYENVILIEKNYYPQFKKNELVLPKYVFDSSKVKITMEKIKQEDPDKQKYIIVVKNDSQCEINIINFACGVFRTGSSTNGRTMTIKANDKYKYVYIGNGLEEIDRCFSICVYSFNKRIYTIKSNEIQNKKTK